MKFAMKFAILVVILAHIAYNSQADGADPTATTASPGDASTPASPDATTTPSPDATTTPGPDATTASPDASTTALPGADSAGGGLLGKIPYIGGLLEGIVQNIKAIVDKTFNVV